MVKQLLEEVRIQIEGACNRSERKVSEVKLIAVSKTKSAALIKEAYDLGVRDFGENKVQELVTKYEQLPKDIRWHMIGHLQRNKVKYIIDKVACIHSVDSLRLMETIDNEAKKKNLTVNVLIEVNMAREESKFGLFPEEIPSFFEQIVHFQNVKVCGLMTIAPYVSDPEKNRNIFRALKKVCVDILKKNVDNSKEYMLSMGMTNDYIVAVEEGSTIIRVGTGVFGERV